MIVTWRTCRGLKMCLLICNPIDKRVFGWTNARSKRLHFFISISHFYVRNGTVIAEYFSLGCCFMTVKCIASVAYVCKGESVKKWKWMVLRSIRFGRAYRSFVHYVRVQLDRGGGDELVTYVERGIAGRYTLFIFFVFFLFYLEVGQSMHDRVS